MSFKKNYEPVISIMKGIAILSVVIGHSATSSPLESLVNQYHLAVFFFVAGYCFKEKYLENFKGYAFRRFKSLYIPFMEFGVFFILFHNFFCYLNLEFPPYSLKDCIHELRNVTIGLTSEEAFMGAMWFCPALFLVSLVSFWGIKVSLLIKHRFGHKFFLFIIPVVLIPIIGRLLTDFNIKSPRCLWQYMQVSGIFFVGFYFHKIRKRLGEPKFKKSLKLIAPAFLVLSVLLYMCGFRARLQTYEIANENLLVVIVIGGMLSVVIMALSDILQNNFLGKILAYVGDNSFCIMALHFLCFKVVSLAYCLYNGDMNCLVQCPTIEGANEIWTIAYIVIGVSFPLFLNYIFVYTKDFVLGR